MSTRSIVVQLRADISDFKRQMSTAGAETRKAMDDVGTAALAVGTLAAAGLVTAGKAYADFDKAMSSVEAATHESAAAMTQLRSAALDAGASTTFSATEAAGAVEELAKAGVSTADVLGGGLDGALALAAAGSLEVGDAAETAASAMTQFRLSGEQIPHIADLLAAGAGKAQGSVGDLGAALNQAGLVANQTGLSIEETTGGLAAFAAAGLIGSDAGTSFKSMLQALVPNSLEAKAAMDEMGFSAYDSQGQFVGLAEVAGRLQAGLAGMSQEQQAATLKTIFGSDAVRAASVLYTEGAAGIESWVGKVDDAGFAAETAAIKLDNLSGDVEGLNGQLDSALIDAGSVGNEALRDLVQTLTAVVTAYNELPDPVKESVVQTGAIVAAAALAAGGFLVLAPRVAATSAAMATLSKTAPKAAAGLAALNAAVAVLAVAAVASALGEVSGAMRVATVDADGLAGALAQLGAGGELGQVGLDLFEAKIIGGDSNPFKQEIESTSEAIERFQAVATNGLTDGFEGFARRMQTFGAATGEASEMTAQLDTALASMVAGGQADEAAAALARFTEGLDPQVADEITALLPQYAGALDIAAGAGEDAAAGSEQVTSALSGVATSADDAQAAVEGLTDSLRAILDQTFSVEEATSAYEESIDALTEAVETNGTTLDLDTDEGRANAAALRDRVTASYELIAAMAETGSSSEQMTAKAADLKGEFVDQATALGLPKDAVEQLAAAFDLLPEQVRIAVEAETSTADGQLQALVSKWANKTVTVRAIMDSSGLGKQDATVAARYTAGALQYARGRDDRAAGGPVRGPGGPTDDKAGLFALSNDEHVWTAAEVAAAGGHEAVEAMRAMVLSAGLGHRATGGRGGANAGTTVSTSFLLAQMGAGPGPVSSARYDSALGAEAKAAADAAAAESFLNDVREAGADGIDALKRELDALEAAQNAAADAAVDGMEAEVDALKKRQDAESYAAKRAQDEELDRLRAKKDNGSAVDAAQRRQADADRAMDLRHDAELEAAQARITEAKTAHKVAADALNAANETRLDQAVDQQAAAEEAAEVRLTAAKDQAKAATDELSDAEDELADARERAVALAEKTSAALTRGAGLGELFSDDRIADMRSASAALAEAGAAADAAGGNARGETRGGALERRTEALRELTAAADSYARSQEAFGATPAAVQAGLAGTIERIQELGAAYGLAADDVAKLTGSLTERAGAGSDLLGSMQAEAARSEELSAAIKSLMSQGLNSDLLDQVIAGGTESGLGLARNLLGGGAGYIEQINGLQNRIGTVANELGAYVSNARFAPDAPEVKVAPIIVESGSLKVDGSRVALSEAVGLDPATLGLLGAAWMQAAASLPPPMVNVTVSASGNFAVAP